MRFHPWLKLSVKLVGASPSSFQVVAIGPREVAGRQSDGLQLAEDGLSARARVDVEQAGAAAVAFGLGEGRRGLRAVYTPAAVAWEKMVPSIEGEWRRKRRWRVGSVRGRSVSRPAGRSWSKPGAN